MAEPLSLAVIDQVTKEGWEEGWQVVEEEMEEMEEEVTVLETNNSVQDILTLAEPEVPGGDYSELSLAGNKSQEDLLATLGAGNAQAGPHGLFSNTTPA